MEAFENSQQDNEEPGKTLRPILRSINSVSSDIEASAVISSDGFTLAAVLGSEVDSDRFGAMCASLLALANRAAQEISRGKLKQVLIEGENGIMLLVYAGSDAVLAVAAKETINLGKIFIDSRNAAARISTSLERISY